MVVKAVACGNYLPGKQQEYAEWANKVVPILTAPEELKKMTVWVNWLGGSPHRVVEFEFEDMESYIKWLAREDIRQVTDEWHDMISDHTVTVYQLAYEKAK